MLNKICESRHPCLDPDLRGKAFRLFVLVVEYDVSCELSISGFYSVEVNFFYT